jgi:hypothetical protein
VTSEFNMMHWYDRLDQLQSQYGQTGGVPDTRYGLTLDQATAPWQDADPKIQQYLADAQKSKDDGGVFGNFTKALGEVVDFGDPLFKALAYPYKELSTYVLSPVTHIIPVLFNEDWQKKINADSTWDAMFDGRSWGHIMDVAQDDSFGRGLFESSAILDKGTNLADLSHFGEFRTNDAEMKKKQDSWQFNALSGAADFTAVMFSDPLYVLGKAAKATRAFSTVREIKPGMLQTPEDYDKLMASEPVTRWLNWTNGRTPEEIASHRLLKRNPMRGQIADLLAHASMTDKDLIFRYGTGQEEALAELQRTSPAIAAQYMRMKGQVTFYQNQILPKLTRTVSSSGAGRPLSGAQKAQLLAKKQATVDKFAEDNRTALKLNETEHNPFAQGPFVSRTEAKRNVYNTYSTIYKPLDDDQQTRLLFNTSGQLERTPQDLADAMKEYRVFVDYAKTSLRGIRKEESFYPRGLPAEFRVEGPVVPPPEVPGLTHPYELWDYDANGVEVYRAKMSDNLDKFDDYLTPEIRQLDATVGRYQRIQDEASAIDANGIRPGIFGSMRELPKGGVYAGLAERSVKVGQFMDKAYQRRYDGNLVHYGFMSRPVYYAAKLQDGLGRGLVPTSFKPGAPEGWRDVDIWLKRVPGLPQPARKAWVRQLMGATGDAEKLAMMDKIEATVVRHMLNYHKITDYETIKSITEVTLGSKKAYVGRMADDSLARDALATPRGSATGTYSAVGSTEGLHPMGLTPDGVALVSGPVVGKQLLNEYPLLPIDDLARAFKRDGRWLYGHSGLAVRDNIMEWSQTANRIWKTSVLARLGYPVRTISDEVLLAGAALSSLTYYAGGFEGAARSVRNVPTRLTNAARRAENSRSRFARQLPEIPLKRPPHERGKAPVQVGKDTWARGFAGGPTGDLNRALASADQKDLFSIYDRHLQHMRTSTHWGELDPTKQNSHLAAWTHALNEQLGGDPLAKRFLLGHSYDEVMDWLKLPEGQAYARSMPHMAHQPEDWLKSVALMVDQYTGGDAALGRAATEGKVSPAMLRKVPVEDRPPVHGGQIDYSLGIGDTHGLLNAASDGFYHVMSKLPADKLVRHPVADLIYQRRLRELVAHAEAQGVRVAQRPDRLYQMEETARQHTVKEIDRIFKDHLFSSPQTALRFVMPFFGAWRASIARWATMIGEDPSIVSRANQGWQGLHKGFDVVDQDGNRLDNQDGKAYGFNTKNSIIMRLPKPIAKALGGIPFVPGEESYGDAPGRAIPLTSFNTVLQGDPWYNPGMGPFVTIPLAQFIRGDKVLGVVPSGDAKPYLADAAKKTGVLPFGTQTNWMQQALPSYGQRAVSADEGFDNQQYTVTFMNILRVEVTKMNLGERPQVSPEQLLKEVRHKTDDLSHLRVLESFLLPFSARPVYYAKEWEKAKGKDWQFLAAKFRQYRQAAETPEQGEEQFLQHFPEAWLYMRSTSENKSGIPANFESWDKAKKVGYLANVAPDIFASAAGVENKDYKKFDSAVYDAQMGSEWNPATGDKFREIKKPAEFLADAQQREGWSKYSKMMDYLRGQLAQRKLMTVDDPGAQDLKTLKSDYIDYIGETNPQWKAAYGSPDLDKRRRVLEQARIVAADKSLPTDPHRTLELQSLRSYLSGRDYFSQQLVSRGLGKGSPDINAKSNRDLLQVWNDYREYLASKDTRFSEIWLDRHFGNDYFQELTQ